MDVIGIYLFDQNNGMAFVKARCRHIPLVLIFLGEIQLSVVKLRSALSPLASCLSHNWQYIPNNKFMSYASVVIVSNKNVCLFAIWTLFISNYIQTFWIHISSAKYMQISWGLEKQRRRHQK